MITQERINYLDSLKAALYEEPYLTKEELAKKLHISEYEVSEGMKHLGDGGLTSFKEKSRLSLVEKHIIYDICELLAINPTFAIRGLTQRTGYSYDVVYSAMKLITPEDIEYARTILIQSGKGGVQWIPDFVPTVKKVVLKDGKTYQDVSEFFGITENGGECYRNVRFTIPEGYYSFRREEM